MTFPLCGRQCGGDIIKEQLVWYKMQTKLRQIRTWRKKYSTNFGLGFSSAYIENDDKNCYKGLKRIIQLKIGSPQRKKWMQRI